MKMIFKSQIKMLHFSNQDQSYLADLLVELPVWVFLESILYD